jgi:hypothetical protein
MTTWPQLKTPPIVEGLIDIRVEPSPTTTFEKIKSSCDELAAEFPARDEMRLLVGQLDISLAPEFGSSIRSQAQPGGIRLASADQNGSHNFALMASRFRGCSRTLIGVRFARKQSVSGKSISKSSNR